MARSSSPVCRFWCTKRKKIIIKKKGSALLLWTAGQSEHNFKHSQPDSTPSPKNTCVFKKKDRGGNLRLAATLPPAEPGTVEQICGEGRTNGRMVGEERASGGVGGLGRGGETEPDWCDGRAP